MGETTTVVLGDYGPKVYRRLKQGGQPVDLTDALILWTAWNDYDPRVAWWTRRDVTTEAKLYGDPAAGLVGLPLWTGRTFPGVAALATITVAQELITATFAACGGDATHQSLYMSKAGLTDLFKVARGVNGFAAGGIPVSVADASLIEVAPLVDQSATNGKVALATPPTPGLVLGAGGALNTPGVHLLAVVNEREGDADFVRTHRLKIIKVDPTTGADTTFPAKGFEYLVVSPEP